MRAALAFVALTASACGFSISGDRATSDAGDAGRDGDLPPDGMVVFPDADLVATNCPWPYVPMYTTPCPGHPGTNVDLSGGIWTLDTTVGALLGPTATPTVPLVTEISGEQFIVWVGNLHIAANATLLIAGPRPVSFIATGSITIDGTISASGSSDAQDNPIPGAGGDPAACKLGMTDGAFAGAPCADHGASGGGGGGFGGGNGGQGGNGGDTHACGGGATFVPGGTGGVSLSTRPAMLRGGCNGANGATSSLAGGSFGHGGAGGGGGGGCDMNTAQPGQPGPASGASASGGAKEGGGGAGAKGGGLSNVAAGAEPAGRGGGGGGGAIGWIYLHGASSQNVEGIVAPSASN